MLIPPSWETVIYFLRNPDELKKLDENDPLRQWMESFQEFMKKEMEKVIHDVIKRAMHRGEA